MQVWSDVIAEDAPIPRKYTSDGDNISPPLRWRDVPANARELALVLDDVKSTGERRFNHWVLYGIDPKRDELPEGIFHERQPNVAPDVAQGTNSLGNVGYNGPQPAAGKNAHYRLRLLAFDEPTHLQPAATIEELERAARGHIIDEAELHATYERPRAVD